MSRLTLSPRALLRLASEQRDISAEERRPLVLAGEEGLVSALERELSRGAAPGALSSDGRLERGSALVYLLKGETGPDDLSRLRAAGSAHLPVICLRAGGSGPLPHVLATNVIRLEAGDAEIPVEKIGRLLARLLGVRSAPLAAGLPALRPAVCQELIHRSARHSALIGAASFVPGPDFPALFYEQARLVLCLGIAHGRRIEPSRAAELAVVLVAGAGLRELVRRRRQTKLLPGWALQGSVAYAGTLALGEAAFAYFAAGDGDTA